MKRLLFTLALTVLVNVVKAQEKIILLDVSHDMESAYTRVNPNMFEEYKKLAGNIIDTKLIINKDKELNENILSKVNVLIILSPLVRERTTAKNNLTTTERASIVHYVRNGGKLIIFMDEEDRVDMEAFGGNDIVKPFGMEYGLDLPTKPDIGATSLVNEVIKNNYELSYSGSRSLTGGTPISLQNGKDGHVHGAYTKLENGGTIIAFGETMTGIFMGGVEMKLPNGMTIVWKGKDDKIFMQEMIEWLLR